MRHDPPGLRALLDTIETQRSGCEMAGSPLYADVLDAVASDVVAGGTCARVLAPLADAPFGDAVLLRFLAAVHLLVLEGAEPDLASQYPSAGGQHGPAVGSLFVAAVARHEDRVVGLLDLGVQTNEVGRSVALLGGYLELARAGLPLRVLEVGASAGLNLGFDRFRYEAGDQAFGPAESRLRFVEPWLGAAPDLDVDLVVASRRGCDLDPIDPTTPAGRLRLRAYVWPDQPPRRARLDAAIAVACEHPVAVDRADAVSWLDAQLAEPSPGALTVVVHSIVFQYLPPDDRRAFLALLDDAGARASHDAPLAWLRMEPGGDRAETRLTTWPRGATELLATSAFHGPPVAWQLARPVSA
ncbi:DUF2332 domain-containing protein [Aquihabitans sp. G128]|uniref:DUF2332 domain-containing protein n=1 Tax=Aquihabitans sp. G128 TaxID=2849779 RepID=UPI001C232AC9|nr:DUF2332 domain-containing protein [Aquihabitans sp. G128]QXC63279.1 DUF2332 domain-containing protein [Aquihabitans sp. G128]